MAGADAAGTTVGAGVVDGAVLEGTTPATGTAVDAAGSRRVDGRTVADGTVVSDGRAAMLAAAGRAFRRMVADRQLPVRATARISALSTVDGSGESTTREPAEGGIL